MSEMPGSWIIRRRFMFAVAAFCMASIAYIVAAELDSRVAETVVTMAFTTLMGIVGSYVFGACWDDLNARKFGATSWQSSGRSSRGQSVASQAGTSPQG